MPEVIKGNTAGGAGNKVVICSKLAVPIQLQLQRWETRVQEYRGQQWQERSSRFYGEKVRLEGTGQPPNALSLGNWPKIEGGAALTIMDESFFDAWAEQNPEFPPLKNGLIWKSKNMDHAVGSARDADPALLSGLEPLSPATFDEDGRQLSPQDPRLPGKTKLRGGFQSGPATT